MLARLRRLHRKIADGLAPPSPWRVPLAQFIAAAAFPKLTYRLRWATRLGPRGLVLYIAFNTAVGFAVRTWAVPYFRRVAEDQATVSPSSSTGA